MKTIDRSSPIPIYHQLYELLKIKIENGEFTVGQYLPSETSLAKRYGVSRLTVRQALSKLVEDGLIEKHRGKGTKVRSRKNVENLMELRSFTEEARESGHVPSSIVMQNTLVDTPFFVADKLNLPSKSKMILLKRLRLLDGVPYVIEWAYINPGVDTRLLNILEMDMSKASLYDYIKKTLEIKFEYAYETLEVGHASAEEARLLSIKTGDCVALRKRFTYTENGECIEYTQSIYRGDKYKFKIRKG
ncbi:GntR family transcriptional regulator [Mesoaciditoga sp.]